MNRLIVTRHLSRDECEEIKQRWQEAWRGADWRPVIHLPTTMHVEIYSYPMREAAG